MTMISKKAASLALLFLVATSTFRSTDAAIRRKKEANYKGNLAKDEEEFWTRYLTGVVDSVTPYPTPPPNPDPTPPPTPPPTPTPTPPPTGLCDGAANVTCTIAPGEMMAGEPCKGSLVVPPDCSVGDEASTVTVLYTYEICNTGSIDLEVTSAGSCFYDLSSDEVDFVKEVVELGVEPDGLGELGFECDKDSNLLPEDLPPIPPGECATAEQTHIIDICAHQCFLDEFLVTDSTGVCGDYVADGFCVPTEPTPSPTPPPTPVPTPPPTGECDGTANVTCTIADGMMAGEPCDGSLVVPPGVCSGGDTVSTVTFEVKFCTCDESDNTQPGFVDSCVDSAEIPAGETVRLTCSDSADNLLFSQNVVEGDSVVMSDDGGLPEEVTCSVFSVAGDILQTFVINPSGSENLFLTEKFGSLTLLGCDDQDCSATILYTYEVCNNGTIDLELTFAGSCFHDLSSDEFDSITQSFNGAGDVQNFSLGQLGYECDEVTDLLPEDGEPIITPDACETVEQTQVINICEDQCFGNEFLVLDSSGLCGGYFTDGFCVPLPEPTPPPTPGPTPPPTPGPTPPPSAGPECVIEFEITCPDCEIEGTTVQPCEERPINMTMLYAGFGCSRAEGENCQEEGKYCCSDYNGGPPEEYGVMSYILATDEDGETVFFSGWVESGTAYFMTNSEEPGERFPADQMIRVYSSEDIENPENLLQKVLYHSSCSQNLDLLNSFGSHTIIGWCDDEGLCVSGFDNQDFTIDINLPIGFEGSSGTVTSLLVATTASSEVEGVLDPVFYNLTADVYGTPLPASVNVSVPIDLTVERDYNYLVTLEVELEDGTVCTGVDLLNFTEGGANIGPTGGGICAEYEMDPDVDFSCEAEDRRRLQLQKTFTVRR